MRRGTVAGLIVVLCLGPAVPGSSAPGRTGWGAKIPAEVTRQFDRKDSGRYLVLLRDKADLSAAAAIPERSARRIAAVKALRDTATRSQEPLLGLLEKARATGAVSEFQPFWLVNAIGVRSSETILRVIAARPEVRAIVPDAERHIIPSTLAQTKEAIEIAQAEWNIDKVGAPAAWDLGIDGTGAVVASIDTGVDFEHPSLASKYRGADLNHDHDWWDAISHEPVPYDDSFHGTHTMGTMVGGDAGGPDENDIGVAPGASWIAAKAFDAGGGGIDTWILEAAQFLTAPTTIAGTDPRPELAPDVVNNSWGGGPCDTFFADAIDAWRVMDIFPAFAIGNSGPSEDSASAPGDDPDAIGVGATDIDDRIADFSSRGPSCYEELKPEISAPGVDVRSSVPGGGFESFDGTSMATPHVAGAVALMMQASAGSLGVDASEQSLIDTALDLGAPGPDNDFGNGRLQVFEAVQLVLRGGTLLGSILDADGNGIGGARIVATSPGANTARTFSKPDGSYRLRLVEGAWALSVEAFGYLPGSASVVIIEGEDTLQDLTLELAPTRVISGVVREQPSATPLEGVTVTVLGTPLAPTTTDANGQYSIVVPAGVYDVEAVGGGCLSTDLATLDSLLGDVVHDFGLLRKLDTFGHLCEEVPFVYLQGATKLVLSGDDDQTSFDLPFAFPFYGQTYSTVFVDTNGYLSFTGDGSAYTNVEIPDAEVPNGAIFALWDDLFVRGSARGVYTAIQGGAGGHRVVFEYRNFELLNTGDLVNFSIVLNQDGSIETHYRSLEGEGSGESATVGIEDHAGAAGLQFSFERRALVDGSAVRYSVGDVGVVAGTVLSAADGLPIGGATISSEGRTARTDSDGTYRFAAFPGTYGFDASAPGYGSAAADATVAQGVTTTLDFTLDAPGAGLTPPELEFTLDDDPQSADATLTNVGTLPLGYQALERDPSGRLLPIIQDPLGDHEFAEVDIGDVSAGANDEAAMLQIELSENSLIDEIGGFIHLDTDQDASTGLPPTELFGKPEQDIGFDHFVDLFDLPYNGTVNLWTADFEYIDSLPAEVEGTTIRFAIPVVHIGGDAAMDVTMVLGNFEGPTDWAPDAGHGSASGIVDLPWLEVAPLDGELEPGQGQALTVTVSPVGLATGVHEAAIVVRSNDPRGDRSVRVIVNALDDDGAVSEFSTDEGSIVLATLGELISGSSRDTGSGVDTVSVTFSSLLGSTTVEASVDCGDDPARAECTWTAAAPSLRPGPTTVTANAVDRDGNVEEPGPSISIIVV